MNGPIYVSLTWAAESCRVSYSTVQGAIERGELLPELYYRDGKGKARPLLTRDAVEDWIERRLQD
jgi:hypothetical protein